MRTTLHSVRDRLKRISRSQLFLTVVVVLVGLGIGVSLRSNDSASGGMSSVVIQADDHILGNRDAPVKIVEYAEGECIYCKRLHPTLLRVLSEYKGAVALVFRHFPLTLHPKSFTEAEALECIAEVKGDPGFFDYLMRLYAATPSNNNVNLAVLPRLAQEMGVSEEAFSACIESGRYRTRILRDGETGIGVGVDSVPHLIIIAPNGREFVFSRSPSYAALNAAVQIALAEQ